MLRSFGRAVDRPPRWLAAARRLARSPLGAALLILLITTSLGWFVNARLLILAPAVAAITLIGSLWPQLSMCGFRARLRFAVERTSEGLPVRAQLALEHRGWLPIWGLHAHSSETREVTDVMNDSLPLAAVDFAQPRSSSTLRVQLTLPRGVYAARGLALRTGFPFGFAMARRPIVAEHPLIVWPRTVPVDPPPDTGGQRESATGLLTHRSGTHGDVMGSRPYRRGDPTRWLHWPQTVRHGELIVREFQAMATPRLWIVVDLARASHVGSADGGSREWSIRVAASMAKQWLNNGAEVGLCAGRSVVPPDGGRKQIVATLDALAAVEAHEHPSALDIIQRIRETGGANESPLFLITTDRVGPDVVQQLADCDWLVVLTSAGFSSAPEDGGIHPSTAAQTSRVWRRIASAAHAQTALRTSQAGSANAP